MTYTSLSLVASILLTVYSSPRDLVEPVARQGRYCGTTARNSEFEPGPQQPTESSCSYVHTGKSPGTGHQTLDVESPILTRGRPTGIEMARSPAKKSSKARSICEDLGSPTWVDMKLAVPYRDQDRDRGNRQRGWKSSLLK